MTISSGTLTCDGTETIDDGETLTVSGGTLNNASGALVITGDAVFAKGAGAFTVGTTLTYGATSTLQYNTGQTAGGEWPASGGPPNVTILSGTITQSSNRTISGNLTLAASTEVALSTANLTTQGNATLNHQSTISTTGIARVDGDLTISGDGTIGTATGGTLEMNGSVDQDVTIDGDISVFNFTVNKTNAAEVIVTTSAGSALKFWDNATAKVLLVQDGVLSFAVNASITDGSGGTIENNNVTLQIDGTGTLRTGGLSLADFASYTLNGTVEYTGSGSVVESIPSLAFTNLTINSTSSNNITVSTGASPTVSGTLDLNDGIVETTSSNSLTLTSGSVFDGTSGSDNSFISGPLNINGTGSKIFPIGDGSTYRPVRIAVSNGSTSFEVFNADPGGSTTLARISSVRYWIGSGSLGTNGTVELAYGSDDGVSTPADLVVAYSSDGGSNYSGIGNGGLNTTFASSVESSQQGSGLTLGYFTLGSTSIDNSLPITLNAFKSKLITGGVSLSWTTESELQNEGFNIYRRDKELSTDWNLLTNSMIPGQGNTAVKTEYEYIDRTAQAGNTYEYMLESISYAGVRVQEKMIEVFVPVPTEYATLGNFPNPFNPSTRIGFRLPETSEISISIYGIQGNLVRELALNQSFEAGEHFIAWDATDNSGQPVASGMYVYLFTAGSFNKTEKMLLLK
jgi:hypothetical protein